MKEVVMQRWDVIPMPETMIELVGTLGQGQPNDIDLLDRKKLPIGDLNTTGVDDGETEAPPIDLIEPDTYIDPILAGTEILPEIV